MAKLDYKSIELKWRKFWEENQIYRYDSKKPRAYSIDTPPPTVSGKMHIGHAFSYSQQDFVARFRRMLEGNVFYPFGTDDNGLPTERLVEKLNNVKSKEMSRAEFIDLCLKTLKKITPDFVQDWKDLGMSCDFNLSYSTIDDNTRKISQMSFIELFKHGEIYKKNFPTIWCPECQTSIAQAELEDKEERSLFSTLKFSCDGKDLLIATTRPELLGACVAVFVHPTDKRYKKLVGKKAKVPLFNFEVPIIEDESANPEKGTGVLMICSYGDRFDVDAINRHNLDAKIILNKQGKVTEGNYSGMKTKEARKKILEDLKKKGLIEEQKEIEHVVNVHDKCGTPIEFVTTEQWFVKILEYKKKFLEQGKKIKWYPEFMKKRYDNWVQGLEWDWGISRERHFGIPIPVWECKECGEIILPNEKELPVDPLQIKKKCPKCKVEAIPEEKVLDTWATSSLTPKIASSLVKDKVTLPFSLRPQAHDIIRTWAFYTIVKSYLHEKKIPWENIVISGNVSLGGEKMSKSKGNVIDPQEVLNKYGADALRFWAAGSKLGNDLDYQEKDLVTGQKFMNKLVNASNFVFMNLGEYDGKKPKKLVGDDVEFLGRLNEVIKISTESFEKYEYSRAKQEVEQFFLGDFCDYYLESVKKVVYNPEDKYSENQVLSAKYTLYFSLLTTLKLIAPIMPFITEEIYQQHFKKIENEKSIHLCSWPKVGKEKSNGDWELVKNYISKVRQSKSQEARPLNAPVDVIKIPSEDYAKIKNYQERFLSVSGCSLLEKGKDFSIKFSEENK